MNDCRECNRLQSIVFPAVGYLLAAVVWQGLLGWPFRSIGGEVNGDFGTNLWNLWWVKYAVLDLHQSPLWTKMVFAPDGMVLTSHSLSLANGLLATPITYLWEPVVAYNGLFLLHTWLTAWGIHVWAKQRTSSAGAMTTALIVACGGFRLSHLNHLNLFSTGFLAWSWWAWDAYLAERRLRDGIAFALLWVATVFACWYHGIAVGLYAGVTLLVWTVERKQLCWKSISCFFSSLAVLGLFVFAYVRDPDIAGLGLPDTNGTHPAIAAQWSNGLRDFLLPVWLSRRPLGSEWSFHPGWFVMLTGIIGLVLSFKHRSDSSQCKMRDATLVAVLMILSLGPVAVSAGRVFVLPAFLVSLIPGFDTLRVYARFSWYAWILMLPYAWNGIRWLWHVGWKADSEPTAWVIVLVLAWVAVEGEWIVRINDVRHQPNTLQDLDWRPTLQDDASVPLDSIMLELPIEPTSLCGAHLARQTVHHRPLAIAEFSRYQDLRQKTVSKYPFFHREFWAVEHSPDRIAALLHEAGIGIVTIDTRHGPPWNDPRLVELVQPLKERGIELWIRP